MISKVLFCYFLFYLINYADIFKPVTSRLFSFLSREGKAKAFFKKLLQCPVCVAAWAGLIYFCSSVYFPQIPDMLGFTYSLFDVGAVPMGVMFFHELFFCVVYIQNYCKQSNRKKL